MEPSLLKALIDDVPVRRAAAAAVVCGPAGRNTGLPSASSYRIRGRACACGGAGAQRLAGGRRRPPVLIDLLAELPQPQRGLVDTLGQLAGEWAIGFPQGNDEVSRGFAASCGPSGGRPTTGRFCSANSANAPRAMPTETRPGADSAAGRRDGRRPRPGVGGAVGDGRQGGAVATPGGGDSEPANPTVRRPLPPGHREGLAQPAPERGNAAAGAVGSLPAPAKPCWLFCRSPRRRP